MSIQKRLSLNYGKHINQTTGGAKLKVKGAISSEAGINMESETGATFPGGCQTSTSTSGVSSACSGSLQHLSVGGGGSDVTDANGSLIEKGEISMKGTVELIARLKR